MSATPIGGSLAVSGLVLLDSEGRAHQLHPSRPTTASQVFTSLHHLFHFGHALHIMLKRREIDQAFTSGWCKLSGSSQGCVPSFSQ